jgi:hypothetical protein
VQRRGFITLLGGTAAWPLADDFSSRLWSRGKRRRSEDQS